MPARDRYPINAQELARQLRVNAKSLRALLRLHDLVPGHVKHKEYRIYREAEKAIFENFIDFVIAAVGSKPVAKKKSGGTYGRKFHR